MKVVVDVNVWISGFLWGGIPGQILRLAYDNKIKNYVSAELIRELDSTLRRPKFESRLARRDQTVESLLTITKMLSQVVDITDITFAELRDPADAKILSTAIAAQAQVLITGDLDLLVLRSVQNIQILTPTQFLSFL
ncbi:MAG: putative toxin-antitoxin system toxin component, PIN family [Cyanobacteria bacterium J06634_5]